MELITSSFRRTLGRKLATVNTLILIKHNLDKNGNTIIEKTRSTGVVQYMQNFLAVLSHKLVIFHKRKCSTPSLFLI